MQISLHQDHAITPRSILRHRPIGDGSTTLKPLPQVPERASRTQHTQVITSTPATTPKRTTTPAPLSMQPAHHQEGHLHALGFVGLGMCAAVILVLLGTLAIPWGVNVWNTIEYGYPRTFQTTTFVGDQAESRNTPSHFIATNLAGHIDIFELPGGNAAHARIYAGPTLSGPQADQVPVTLQFVVHGDPRYPDMVVHVGATQMVYHNMHGVFQLSH